jgi:hypothetical protein
MRTTDCTDDMDVTGGFLAGVRRGGRSTIEARFDARSPRRADLAALLLLVVNHICIRVIRVIRG